MKRGLAVICPLILAERGREDPREAKSGHRQQIVQWGTAESTIRKDIRVFNVQQWALDEGNLMFSTLMSFACLFDVRKCSTVLFLQKAFVVLSPNKIEKNVQMCWGSKKKIKLSSSLLLKFAWNSWNFNSSVRRSVCCEGKLSGELKLTRSVSLQFTSATVCALVWAEENWRQLCENRVHKENGKTP